MHTRLDIHTTVYDQKIFCHFYDRKWNLIRISFPTATMLDYPGVVRKFGTGATHAIACNSDEEVGDISKIDNIIASYSSVFRLVPYVLCQVLISCFLSQLFTLKINFPGALDRVLKFINNSPSLN